MNRVEKLKFSVVTPAVILIKVGNWGKERVEDWNPKGSVKRFG